MVFKRVDRGLQRLPGINKLYRRQYGRVRRMFYDANRRWKLVNTPRYVHWHATYACNFHCVHCGANAGQKETNSLGTAEIVAAVRDMGEMGVRTFIVTGGEPLLRRDLFEVFGEAREAGIGSLSLATNGYLVEEFKEELKRAGLATVHISIDGPAETNDQIRGIRGASQKAFQALRFFEEIGVKTRVLNTLVHKENIGDLKRFANVVYHSPANLWNLQIPLGVGRSRNSDLMCLNDEEIAYLFSFMLKARRHFPVQIASHAGYLGPLDHLLRPSPFFCGAGVENCAILADGEVVGCQILYDTAYSEGNLRDRSFREIWHEKYGRFKMPERGQECQSCPHFSACQGGCVALRKIEGRCLREIWGDETVFGAQELTT